MAYVFNKQNNDKINFEIHRNDSDNLTLIIDMQEGFRCLQTDLITSPISNLIENFNSDFIFTKFINKPDSNFVKQLKWNKFTSEEDQEILKEFNEYDFPIIEHSGYSILNNSKNLNQYKKIYLTGIYSDICVKKTAMDLFDLNFEIFVIADCVNSPHGETLHKSALESLKHIIGDDHVISSYQLTK